MYYLPYGRVVLLSLVVLLLGCDKAAVEKPGTGADPSKILISGLESQLAEVRKDLARQQDQNTELMGRVQSLLKKVAEKDGQLEEFIVESRKNNAAQRPRSSGGGKKDLSRIKLIGAKALAEHKAEELSKRLDTLSRDLEQKERDLNSIRHIERQKDAEVRNLTKKISQLQAENDARSAELNRKMEQITEDLNKRSASLQEFKSELNEKSELLETLKNAVSDAGRLKKAAEEEVERLTSTLTETNTQLEAAREDAKQQRQTVAQLTTELERIKQESAGWMHEAQQIRGQAKQLQDEINSLSTRSADIQKQFQSARQAAERSRQEAEQYRLEGERFREEAVKLRVELKGVVEENEEIKNQALDLVARMKELESIPPVEDTEKPSDIDRIMSAAPVTGTEPKDSPKPAGKPDQPPVPQPEQPPTVQEKPYEAPTFEDIDSLGPEVVERTPEKPAAGSAKPPMSGLY